MQRRLDIDALEHRIALLEEEEIDIANELRALRAQLWTLRRRGPIDPAGDNGIVGPGGDGRRPDGRLIVSLS